uniref:Glycosyl transferase n=1 Tax=uncultured marine thaumarchaeote KM3_82_C03 TaxID=1456303 RepID=A0A075HUZ2_9ARCH|nr:glycosyl transferase [uncultured marine thaumarchaeote KM3_82_C03]
MKIVCIPAYNEEIKINDVVKKSLPYADKVIVCDDGSTDDTAALAKKAGAVVISHEKNQGYGATISTLFDYCRKNNAEIMVTLDGDGQHNPDQIPDLINVILKHKVDVVIGSRSLRDDKNLPGYRKTGIKIITSTINSATNLKVTDSQSGFRAYSKEAINLIRPTESGMAVSTEILLKISNNGLSIAEVPITVSYSGDTSTEHPVKHGTHVIGSTLKYVSIKHPMYFYGIPGILLFISGLIMGVIWLDGYLDPHDPKVLYGYMLGSVVSILLGSMMIITSVLLFSMANLMRARS